LAPQPYWEKVSQDKFHTTDLDALSLKQLTDLRNTLAARAHKHRNSVEEPALVGCNVTVGSSVTLALSAQDEENIPF
jgi:hypothetical protein